MIHDRYPSVRQLIVIIILELEKLEKSRFRSCVMSCGIKNFERVLRREINWN